ncbi:MAG: hypothetical protein FJ271_24925 [Planctomycetes bacterium]|nr:hypothetical protein [Planctomycetota bacterium]
MPLKLNLGLSKKIGESNYGSRGASVNVEIEVESALAGDATRLRERIRQVFGLVRDSLAEELGNGDVPAAAATADNQGNGSPVENGPRKNGSSPRAATQSQCKALFAITKSQGLNLNQLLRERFRIGKPEQLSIREVSQLIDELKSSASREGA